MSPRAFLRLAPAALLAGFALLVARAPACAPVYNTKHSVRVASETALIIWDAKRPRDGKAGTQHFIRRANFDTTAPDFGFLVPTPSKPSVHKADDGVFAKLEEYTKPKIVDRQVTGPPGYGGRGPTSIAIGSAKAPASPVDVVGGGRIDSLEYVVLRGTGKEPKPVLDWLAKHGYSTREALEEWLTPYLEKGWYLTAFKFVRGEGLGTVPTSAVRLTFGADRPFYPYREPEDMRSPGAYSPRRLLRLYVLADDRVHGTLTGNPWMARTVWADHLTREQAKAGLLDELKVDVDRDGEWSPRLTMFEDATSPRQGIDEVYFDTTGDQGIVERIEYRDVYGSPREAMALPEETRSRLVIGTSVVAGALLLGLAGIALYFFLSGRSAMS